MTKVATLSFQHAYNYGAVFQVAALQYIIESLGAECDVIDYRCPAIDCQYDFKPIVINNSLIRNLRANLVLLPFIRGKKKNFQHWMNSLKKTEVIENNNQLRALNERYDKFVVGSDQVWNLKCQGYDASFFLDFVNDDSKKVAYAASFGTYDVLEEDRLIYAKHICKFSSISVRESRGVELVKDLSGRDSVACMDPVLLVGREFWESKADKSNMPNEKYIFVYHLGHGDRVAKFAKRLQKQTGYKVLFTTGHLGNMAHYSLFDGNESMASPERLLALISNAEYIVTNSFHVTVLSLIFQRQFFSVVKGKATESYNTRIFNLLSDYNLVERICESYAVDSEKNRISYDEVERARVKNAELSIDFLRKAIFG